MTFFWYNTRRGVRVLHGKKSFCPKKHKKTQKVSLFPCNKYGKKHGKHGKKSFEKFSSFDIKNPYYTEINSLFVFFFVFFLFFVFLDKMTFFRVIRLSLVTLIVILYLRWFYGRLGRRIYWSSFIIKCPTTFTHSQFQFHRQFLWNIYNIPSFKISKTLSSQGLESGWVALYRTSKVRVSRVVNPYKTSKEFSAVALPDKTRCTRHALRDNLDKR
jgi:hypothetical protein